MCEREREKIKRLQMVGMRGESLGKWWYGDLAGERVTHCLCGPSLRDGVSSIEKKILLRVPNETHSTISSVSCTSC